jgi:hypothetical protein
MSKALDAIGEIQLHISALAELTQQLVDLSNYPDSPGYYDKFNAIDYARVATQEKLTTLVNGLENYLRYGVKIEAIEGRAEE